MLTVSAIALLLPSMLLTVGAAPAGPPRCAVVDSIGRCLVSAVDPGRPGAPRAGSRTAGPGIGARTLPQPKAANDEQPEPPPMPRVRTLPLGAGWAKRPVADLDALLAEASAEPDDDAEAPSPEILALRAVRQLDLPAPAVHISGGSAVVGVALWLWVDPDQAFAEPVSATATAGAAQVTAEATFVGLEWSMGPPGSVVRCNGPGTPWAGQEGPSPDCGYTYGQRSLGGRTGGTGRWPVVVTAIWSVTWTGFSAGAPVTGQQDVRVPTTTSLPVGEVQVLVDGDGS